MALPWERSKLWPMEPYSWDLRTIHILPKPRRGGRGHQIAYANFILLNAKNGLKYLTFQIKIVQHIIYVYPGQSTRGERARSRIVENRLISHMICKWRITL